MQLVTTDNYKGKEDGYSDEQNTHSAVEVSKHDKAGQTSPHLQSQSYENSKYWKMIAKPLLAEFIGTMFFHCSGMFSSIGGNPIFGALGTSMTLLGLCGAFFPIRSV